MGYFSSGPRKKELAQRAEVAEAASSSKDAEIVRLNSRITALEADGQQRWDAAREEREFLAAQVASLESQLRLLELERDGLRQERDHHRDGWRAAHEAWEAHHRHWQALLDKADAQTVAAQQNASNLDVEKLELEKMLLAEDGSGPEAYRDRVRESVEVEMRGMEEQAKARLRSEIEQFQVEREAARAQLQDKRNRVRAELDNEAAEARARIRYEMTAAEQRQRDADDQCEQRRAEIIHSSIARHDAMDADMARRREEAVRSAAETLRKAEEDGARIRREAGQELEDLRATVRLLREDVAAKAAEMATQSENMEFMQQEAAALLVGNEPKTSRVGGTSPKHSFSSKRDRQGGKFSRIPKTGGANPQPAPGNRGPVILFPPEVNMTASRAANGEVNGAANGAAQLVAGNAQAPNGASTAQGDSERVQCASQ